MAVLRINAMGLLADAADIEAVRDVDMHILIRVFRHARPDNRKIFLLIAGRAGVNKGRGAGPQLVKTNQTPLHLGLTTGYCVHRLGF